MLKYLLSFFVLASLNVQIASAQSFEWAITEKFTPRTFCGEYGTSHSRVSERIIDNDGNIIRTGSFAGTLDFDPGPGESFLTNSNPGGASSFIQKLDPAGNLIWAKKLGIAHVSHGTHVRVDGAGNYFLSGTFIDSLDADPGPGEFFLHAINESQQIYVIKLDPDGNFVWAKKLDGSGAWIASMEVNYEDNLVFVGTFLDTLDCDPGPAELYLGAEVPELIYARRFIATWDNDGDLIWAKLLDKQNDLVLVRDGCDLDEFGTIYLAGYYRGPYDFDPGPDVFVIDSSINTRGYIRKLDEDGNFLSVKILKGDEDGWPNPYSHIFSIHVESPENITLGGYFIGNIDFDMGVGEDWASSSGINEQAFVIRVDGEGNTVWKYIYGSEGDERVAGVTVNEFGNTLVIGDYTELVDFDNNEDAIYDLDVDTLTNTAIIELSPDGEFLWARGLGGSNCVVATEVLTGPDGAIYAAGTFKGTADLNPNTGVDEFMAEGDATVPYFVKINKCDPIPMGDPEYLNNCADPYFWSVTGLTYSTSGLYTGVMESAEGCDSLVGFDLKITNLTVVKDELTLTALEEGAIYQWLDCDDGFAPIDGATDQTFTAETPGNYAVLITVDECVEISACVCVDFNVFSEINIAECISYTTPSHGVTYYESGIYMDTTIREGSCGDSIITINLTIGEIEATVTATEDETFLVADLDDAEYQWVDCDNDYEPIPGATNQFYIVTSSGSYAVIVSLLDCVDTSDCYNYYHFSIPELAENNVQLFPNPTEGELHLILNRIEPLTNVYIWSTTGQQIANYTFENQKDLRVDFDAAPGLYIAEVKVADGSSVFLQFVNK
ncbi:MAG: T9SS type A sorting domain-containing protein [Crocinitomix sp.]|nr:T9SS type A sorting domain-containing protein [Crocinitomix sp.]